MGKRIEMNKNLLFATTALLVWAAALGQQTSKSDMTAIVRLLAAQISEINGTIGQPDKMGENYFRCDMQDKEGGSATLQVYRYKRPAEAADLVLITYDIHDFPMAAWLKCYTHDRKSGAFAEVEIPFTLLPASQFNKEEFEEEHGYWRTEYTFLDNGNVLIDASPGMAWHCWMLVRHDGKGNFRLFRRAGYDAVNMEIVADNAETEKYVQNVVRPNFQRINAINTWEYVEEKERPSPQSATLTYYYSNSGLEKIVAKIDDQTNLSVVEYYFLDGSLSFIYGVTTRLGASATKTERRWYLNGATCIRGIGDNGAKLTPAQIEKEFLDSDTGAFTLYQSIIKL